MYAILFAAAIALPKIDFLYPPPYGSVFDRACAAANAAEVRETVQRRGEFQKKWDAEGPAYLSAAFNAIGKPFPYQEMQMAMTVCPGTSTMSVPLMINMSMYLSMSKDVVPADDFAEKVFHELMHHYVHPVVATSSLRKKYASEDPVTLAHLHVAAMEKFVLMKLGKTDELTYLASRYQRDPRYKRAWEIMNAEGMNAFIEELRGMPAEAR